MEVINQRVHLTNGIPSKIAGEWPGIISNHFNSSKRIVKPPISERNNIVEYMKSTRRHFPPYISQEIKILPHQKMFPDLNNKESNIQKIKPSLKYIEPKYEEKIKWPRKYLANSITIKPEKIYFKRINKIDETPEYIIENVLQAKKRFPNKYLLRNGIRDSSPGDKIYKNVEYSPEFFKQEGLIVGSTNTINYKKTQTRKSDNFYDTLDLSIKTLNPNKLWANKNLRESAEIDKNYVISTKKWEDEYLNPLFQNEGSKVSKINETIKQKGTEKVIVKGTK